MSLLHNTINSKTRLNSAVIILSIFSHIFIISQAFSQDSYKPGIVYIYGDRRPGLLKIDKSNSSILFINNRRDKVEINLMAIDSLSINGINYQKFSPPTGKPTYLLKSIVGGQNSLFKIVNNRDNLFLLSSKDSSILLTKENSFTELRKFTYDINSEAINTKLIKHKGKLNEKLLIDVVYDYNTLKYPDKRSIKQKENFSLAIGAFGGLTLSQINYIGHDKDTFFQYNGLMNQSFNPSFGLFANLNPLNQFSFEVAVYYLENSGSREVLPKSVIEPYRTERVGIKEEAFHIPLLVNYKMFFTKLPVYFKLGPKYVLYKKIEDYYTFNNGIEKPIFFFDKHFGFGFDAGLGIEKTIHNKSLVRLEYKFGYHGIQDKITRMAINSNHSLMLKYGLIWHKKSENF